MHTLLFASISILAYIQLGLLIGKLSLLAWTEFRMNRDGSSRLLTFLLFPISSYRNLVGLPGEALISDHGYNRWYLFYSIFYRIIMVFFWPVKLVWNIVAIAILSQIWLFRS